MSEKFIAIEEAAQRGAAEGFPQNVRREVIPRLIERGALRGKTVKGKPAVADDAVLARIMRLGIERFVYNQQCWSFTAVRAQAEAVAGRLKGRQGVLRHEPNVKVMRMRKDAGVEGRPDRRDVFLVQPKDTDWSVIVQTVHWVQSADMVVGGLLAAELSEGLKTKAVAAWDDDFAGSTALVCENGELATTLTDEDWVAFYGFFYEEGIALPPCFISAKGDKATLLADDPAEFERTDHFVLAIPTESQTNAPHVFYKLGMMAQAMAADPEDMEDEAAFRAHMTRGLWDQVQAIRRAQR